MGIKNILDEIIAKNFPILKKENGIQVQEARRYQTNGPKQIHTKT